MSKNKQEKSNKAKRGSEKRTMIGGQALLEGVMMRGKSSMAMAVRSPEGNIELETTRLKSAKKWYMKAPIIRGCIAFFSSLVSGVTTITKSAEVSSPDEETPSKGWMGFAVVLGLALGIAIFILLPSFLTDIFMTYVFRVDYIWLSSVFEGVLRILIFIGYLLLTSLLKDIRRTFMYHGAEHRTINCFESGMDMTVENVQKCSTKHNRCGTTFLFFVMVFAIIVFALMNWLFSIWGINAANYTKVGNTFIKFGIRIAMLPLVAGLSYELLRGFAMLPDNLFTRIIRAPGLALQKLTTKIPDDDMAEVALKAFMAVYDMDSDPSIEPVKFFEHSIKEAREIMRPVLNSVGADASEEDWILCDVLGVERNELNAEIRLNASEFAKVNQILKRRKQNEPLWYILGYAEFYGIRLIVNNNVLIPRPETELLAEAAIKEIAAKTAEKAAAEKAADIKPGIKVLDLCTGSGCIAAALKANTDATVTASDISDKALSVAAQNLRKSAELIKSDLFCALENRVFDIIVSNPPYIKSADIDTLQDEIRCYEPANALDGGADGLDVYKRIVLDAPAHLSDGGVLLLEIGAGQADDVNKLLSDRFKDITVIKDYAGIDRIIRAVKKVNV